ncbi:MAG: argininosuccinate lyase [Pseudomonadota bacterium]|nr:argininosuccinate lyase [Pseudomonadota bacterium]
MSETSKSNKMWGGRFSSKPDEVMEKINSSVSFDKRLFQQDIRGSIAHLKMLESQGIIGKVVAKKLENGLKKIKAEIEEEKFDFRSDLEDIHMNIENRLQELIGKDAGFLHTARSRNDQVATDLRLWIRSGLDDIVSLLQNLMKTLVVRAEEHVDIIMPGFTHLQVAQPVTLGHHLLAYVEMFDRDITRYQDNRKRLNECPLGAAALAGTSFDIDRNATAKALGFEKPMQNSLDAVSDRDFCIEFLAASSICATHLSRFAEELVLWSSAQFNYVKFSDSFSSGSSIMPQKRNPDAAELIRAKVGRVNGSLIAMLTTIKGLPLAYSKDLQEDKEAIFDCFDTIVLCLNAMNSIMKDVEFNKERLESDASIGYSTATDLADWLVRSLKLTFREAHKVTGSIVKIAEENNCHLKDLDLDTLQSVNGEINSKVYRVLGERDSVESRNSLGGTAPSQVRKQVEIWKKKLM